MSVHVAWSGLQWNTNHFLESKPILHSFSIPRTVIYHGTIYSVFFYRTQIEHQILSESSTVQRNSLVKLVCVQRELVDLRNACMGQSPTEVKETLSWLDIVVTTSITVILTPPFLLWQLHSLSYDRYDYDFWTFSNEREQGISSTGCAIII